MRPNFEIINLNPNVIFQDNNWQIKTVRGQQKNLQVLSPLSMQELAALKDLGLNQEDLRLYSILRSYTGTPYGPVYPQGTKANIFHTDCVDLLWQFIFDAYGIALNQSKNVIFDRNDKTYARLTTPITKLHYNEQPLAILEKLALLKTGDLAFHGHQSRLGEGGISVWHAFIIGKPIVNEAGTIIDYTIFNPSGYYSNNRQNYTGMVLEGGAPSSAGTGQTGQSLLATLYNQAFWFNKNGTAKRQEIFIGRIK